MTASTPSKEELEAGHKKKVYYADNLRSSLTALVILHHAAMNFGGVGLASYYGHKPMSSIPLVGFNVLNQTCFMGIFMYLGGHFSEKTSKRKSASQFVKDRLHRLGLPAITYTLICAPLTLAFHRAWNGGDVNLKWYLEYVKTLRGLKGVVWFIGLLLCFDLTLIAGKKLRKALGLDPIETESKPSTKVRGLTLAAAIAATSAGDFLLRTIWPVGAIVDPIGFQPAYFAHYAACYFFGTYVNDMTDAIPSTRATIGLGAGSIASAYIFAKTLIANKSVEPMLGGWNTSAATYAVANNTIGYLLGSLLLRGFKKYGNFSWGGLTEPAYSAFLVHMPILTAITIGSVKWQANGILKTAAVGGATIASSWAAATVIDRLWEKVEKLADEASTKVK